MKFKKKSTTNCTLLFSMIIIWCMLPLSAAADYKTKLNNELAALGLNNGEWLYNSEDVNLTGNIPNREC